MDIGLWDGKNKVRIWSEVGWKNTTAVRDEMYEIVGHELWIVDIASSCCSIFFVYLARYRNELN